MQIEVLYFEDCPNHLPTVERINAVLREEGCRAGSGANSKNSTPYGGVKEVRVASFPSFLHIEG
jgi:hypothetical protein